MKRYLVAAFLFALGASAAIASGYSEINLGIDAYRDEDWTATISHARNALAAPDLPSGYRVAGQLDRGDAYLESGMPDLAIGDYSAVIAADPNYLEALQRRGRVYAALAEIRSCNHRLFGPDHEAFGCSPALCRPRRLLYGSTEI